MAYSQCLQWKTFLEYLESMGRLSVRIDCCIIILRQVNISFHPNITSLGNNSKASSAMAFNYETASWELHKPCEIGDLNFPAKFPENIKTAEKAWSHLALFIGLMATFGNFWWDTMTTTVGILPKTPIHPCKLQSRRKRGLRLWKNTGSGGTVAKMKWKERIDHCDTVRLQHRAGSDVLEGVTWFPNMGFSSLRSQHFL